MFLPYNTDQAPMKLPEYGRHIQHLVEHCVEIPDREERNACAQAIVKVMEGLFPQMVGEDGDRSKIWDHLNILSGFRLDIDFPCEVVSEEKMNPKPEPIGYGSGKIKYRHYGRIIQNMVEVVAEMPDGAEKDQLIALIAPHMKKQLLLHNKEGVSNAKVLHDLEIYSDGRIALDPESYLLHEFKEVKTPVSKKKRKK